MLSAQVEDTVLDVYDLVYEQAVHNLSGAPRQQLVAIQDMVSVGGGGPPRVSWPWARRCPQERGVGERPLVFSPWPGQGCCLIWRPNNVEMFLIQH